MLRKHEINLMVLDWALDTCGAEVLRFSREHFPAIPIIVMSGLPCDVRTDALLQQADAFLAKPFSAAVLTAQVQQLLLRTGDGSRNFLPHYEEDIMTLEDLKAKYIRQVALRLGSITATAKALNVHRQTVSAVLR
jgi:DNA-binding response OmpR family regulator